MPIDTRVYLLVGAAFAVAVALSFLVAMFRREAVKQDLSARFCEPIHIRWVPIALWHPRFWATVFRVAYRDIDGRVHNSCCEVSQALSDSPLGPRRVYWIKDELSGPRDSR